MRACSDNVRAARSGSSAQPPERLRSSSLMFRETSFAMRAASDGMSVGSAGWSTGIETGAVSVRVEPLELAA